MDAGRKSESAAVKNLTTSERKSDHELVVTRTLNAPARLVFEAFSRAELFQQWWVPKSLGIELLSCEIDVRVGGKYKLVFGPASSPMAFFGRYLEVVPNARLSWTNEEGGEDGPVSTVVLEEKEGKTLLVLTERYASKAKLDDAIASGTTSGDMSETFNQLEVLLTQRG